MKITYRSDTALCTHQEPDPDEHVSPLRCVKDEPEDDYAWVPLFIEHSCEVFIKENVPHEDTTTEGLKF